MGIRKNRTSLLPIQWVGHTVTKKPRIAPGLFSFSVIAGLSCGCEELDTISSHSSWSTVLAYGNPTTRPLCLTDGSYSSYRFRCTGALGTLTGLSVLRPTHSSVLTHGKAYQKLDNSPAVNTANIKKSPISGDFSCVTMWTTGWITRWISNSYKMGLCVSGNALIVVVFAGHSPATTTLA